MAKHLLTREQVEDFLYHEAELLDNWQLVEWAALYAADASYEVTSPASEDPANSNPATSLFLISDQIDRIEGRAKRLLKKTAHAEYPHSKTRHLVTNVRLLPADKPDEVALKANFAVFRAKEDNQTVFMGESRYRLRVENETIRIVHKRCILDLNSLYNQGRLTIIL